MHDFSFLGLVRCQWSCHVRCMQGALSAPNEEESYDRFFYTFIKNCNCCGLFVAVGQHNSADFRAVQNSVKFVV